MFFHCLVLAGSLIAILLACNLFVNSIEWAGKRLKLSDGVVGSVLAAVGTAMPETMIPIVAILLTSGKSSHEVGIGAILGAPFMLSTLAFFVTGIAIYVYSALGRRTAQMTVERHVVERDLGFFLFSYGLVVLTGLVHMRALHVGIGVVVLVVYVHYLRVVFSDKGVTNRHVGPLFFARRAEVPGFLPIFLQLALALGLIIAGAHYFVGATVCVAAVLGVSPLILSLIITPIATELPEKANSIIWTGRSKDTLALGNITGAMVFQSTFPVTIGLVFTSWDLDGVMLLSACLALTSGVVNYVILKVRGRMSPFPLVLSGALYLVFVAYIALGA